MTAAADTMLPELDIKLKLAQIDQQLASHDRLRQEVKLAPWALLATGLAAGAGFMGAAIALAAFLIKGF